MWLFVLSPPAVEIRPRHQAAQVGSDAQAFQRPRDASGYRVEADVVYQDLEQVPDTQRPAVVVKSVGGECRVHGAGEIAVFAKVAVGLGQVDVARAAGRDQRRVAVAL